MCPEGGDHRPEAAVPRPGCATAVVRSGSGPLCLALGALPCRTRKASRADCPVGGCPDLKALGGGRRGWSRRPFVCRPAAGVGPFPGWREPEAGRGQCRRLWTGDPGISREDPHPGRTLRPCPSGLFPRGAGEAPRGLRGARYKPPIHHFQQPGAPHSSFSKTRTSSGGRRCPACAGIGGPLTAGGSAGSGRSVLGESGRDDTAQRPPGGANRRRRRRVQRHERMSGKRNGAAAPRSPRAPPQTPALAGSPRRARTRTSRRRRRPACGRCSTRSSCTPCGPATPLTRGQTRS